MKTLLIIGIGAAATYCAVRYFLKSPLEILSLDYVIKSPELINLRDDWGRIWEYDGEYCYMKEN